MKNEIMVYGLIFLAAFVLAYSVFATFSKPAYERNAQGLVANSLANQQYFQQQAAQSGSECGDLNDEANVQHLSHHPGQFADCLKQVNPAFLQKATGKTLQQILGG